jgi:hypothetical protein
MNFVTPERVAVDAGVSLRTVHRNLATGTLRSRLIDGRRVVEVRHAKPYVAKRRALKAAAEALSAS